MSGRSRAGLSMVAVAASIVALNFYAFGPIGGLLMMAVEFTVVVFVLLGLILCRHFASGDQR